MAQQNGASSFKVSLHLFGILLVVAVALAVRYVYRNYLMGGTTVQASQWQLGLGLAGGAMTVGLIVLPLRRRLKRGVTKTFEPWMITHAYLGAASGVILLHHGFFHFTLDLPGILLLSLMLSIVLGMVLIVLRKHQRAKGGEAAWTKRVSSFHTLFSVLTGILLVVHVLFDAVVH